ncbi:MAG: SDR family oxidoreductase [Betaproteobacteria bacterium]|jgi:3-hydroxybutyrate dehydrogenase|nr:SDR family oxidoreductase [Betaproteobacteria bacterium]
MLQGKSALITGSLGGIGFEIAAALARKGCCVLINGFADEEVIEHQLKLLQETGAQAHYHGADISKPQEIDAMVLEAERLYGKVDILVNNAVTRHDAEIENLPPEQWAYALAVNLSAPYHFMHRLVPGMKSRNWGRIINLASIYGVEGTANRSDYVATKHGLVGLTKVVALECAEYNITVNALCPAAVHTPHLKKLITQRAQDAGVSEEALTADFLKARQPSKRFVQPSKVGSLAAFLCSEDACDITGTPIPIDGGWQARA